MKSVEKLILVNINEMLVTQKPTLIELTPANFEFEDELVSLTNVKIPKKLKSWYMSKI